MSRSDDPARSPVVDGHAPEAAADGRPPAAAADSGSDGSATRPPARSRGYVMPLEPPDPTLTMAKITEPVKEDPAPLTGRRPAGAPTGGRRPGGRGPLVLAIAVAVLALAGSGMFGYLWWSATDELASTRATHAREVAELTGTLAQQERQLGDLEEQLRQAGEERRTLESELDAANATVEQLQAQQDEVRECVRLARRAAAAWESGDQATFAETIAEAGAECRKADRLLRR